MGRRDRLGRRQRGRQGRLLPPARPARRSPARSRPAPGFGATIASATIDAGYPDARIWGDVDGDHRADYCRRSAAAPRQPHRAARARPAPASPTDPRPPRWTGAVPRHGARRRHRRRPRGLLPADGRRADPDMSCAPSTGQGFGGTFSAGPIDPGEADRPRVGGLRRRRQGGLLPRAASAAACSLSTGAASPRRSPRSRSTRGYRRRPRLGRRQRRRPGRLLPPRRQRPRTRSSRARSRPAAASARRSPPAGSTGAPTPAPRWVDFDGDGDRDFCRPSPRPRPTSAVLHAVDAGRLRRAPKVSGPLDLGLPDRPRLGRPQRRPQGRLLPARRRRRPATSGSRARSPTAPGSAPSPPRRRRATGRRAAGAHAVPAPHRPRRIVVTLGFFLSKGRFTRLNVKGVPRGAHRHRQVPEGLRAQELHQAQRAAARSAQDRSSGRKRIKVGT